MSISRNTEGRGQRAEGGGAGALLVVLCMVVIARGQTPLLFGRGAAVSLLPELNVTLSVFYIGESGSGYPTNATFTFTRSTTSGTLTMPYSTVAHGSNSTVNTDFTLSQASPMVFAPGMGSTNLYITMLDDAIVEDDSELAVFIDADAAYSRGGNYFAAVNIYDSTNSLVPSSLVTNLWAYWNMDEASGSRADLTGNGRTLAQSNTVGSAAGVLTNAAVFATGGNKKLQGNVSNLGANRTMNMWVYPVSTVDGYFFSIGDYTGDAPNNLALGVDGGGANFIYYDSSSNRVALSASFTANTWTMITVTASNFVGGTTLNFYQNGSLVQTYTPATFLQISYDVTIGGGPSRGGAFKPSSPSITFPYWNGDVDEVGVWTRVLTAGEIASLYNGGAGRAYPFR